MQCNKNVVIDYFSIWNNLNRAKVAQRKVKSFYPSKIGVSINSSIVIGFSLICLCHSSSAAMFGENIRVN